MNNKVLFLANRDSEGGASEWLYKIVQTLNNAKFEVALVVKNKRKQDDFIFQLPIISIKKSFLQRIYNFILRTFNIKKEYVFITKSEYSFFPGEDQSKRYVTAEDILSLIPFVPNIIITGLTFEFVNFSTLLDLQKRCNAAVYSTAFDMSVFTGGCHVVNECDGFVVNCSNCPGVIAGDSTFTTNNLQIKQKYQLEGDFGLMYGSPWGLHQAEKSLVHKNSKKVYIGNCVDTEMYNNANRDIAKRIFGFDNSQKVIFAGADNVKEKRKGQLYLVEALSILHERQTAKERDSIIVFIAGNNNKADEVISKIPYQVKLVNFISDTRLLSLAYQASDVFVNTSIEDLGPAMVGEALACGTPVVGFEMGLLFNDSLVINERNGYRAKIKDSNSLANGIEYFVKLPKDYFDEASRLARESILRNASQNFFVSVIKEL